MKVSTTWRKILLTLHVSSSVGWFGGVAAFLAVALVGLGSTDVFMVRAAIVALAWVGWYVITPLAVASVVTGVLLSLLTSWGLWRHYWVVTKIVATAASAALLVLHMQPITVAANLVARSGPALSERLEGVREQFVIQAGAATVALLLLVALSVFKPKGLTAYGHRRLDRIERQR